MTASRAWTNRDSVLLVFFPLYFIQGRPSSPRLDAPAPPRAPPVPSPRFPTSVKTFSLHLAPAVESGSRASYHHSDRARMHAPLFESRPRRASTRTNNLTPHWHPLVRYYARVYVIDNVAHRTNPQDRTWISDGGKREGREQSLSVNCCHVKR